MLKGKKILIGVCGSIAAYKTAMLTRLLIKQGAEVKIIMTKASKEFITPVTLSTLSKNPVLSEFYKDNTGQWNSHVELGLWADAMIIAPASANTIAKMANGLCDNLLTAVYLSARCPVYLAPAMDLDMYQHPATTSNLKTLEKYGNKIIAATYGELASGLVGEGRMAEPEEIVAYLESKLDSKHYPLAGKKVLITAGPTYESIDPVRFIGNHSSGKMGYSIADVFAENGADVTLVSGPSEQHLENKNIKLISVKSAHEMYEACLEHFESTDITVLAAAVADYRPVEIADHKIKKKASNMVLDLEKTVDIAQSLGELKKKNQFTVGFALETEQEDTNAVEKLNRKHFDIIVLNSLNDKGAGFGYDTNKITIFDTSGEKIDFEMKSKKEVAIDIVNEVIKRLP
jgi:phosphopantothenoylcysteine decarboxylase/phosphopantothenate--cysteine ligase